MTHLQPVERRSTPELIADQLRANIVDGSLRPGDQLGEAQLADQMQVSRGPVREAMQRLIQEGLLEYVRNRGVFVVELGVRDIDDIYFARSVVERSAAEVLMERDDQDTCAALATLLDGMSDAADAKDWPRLSELDLQFHHTIVQSSRSPRLVRMFETLLAETRICLAALEQAYPRPADIVDEHTLIQQALAAGRHDEALDRIDAHMVRARSKLAADPPGGA